MCPNETKHVCTFAAAFGATDQAGTIIKFNAPTGQDSMMKNGVTTNIQTRHQCITAMKEYEAKSLEVSAAGLESNGSQNMGCCQDYFRGVSYIRTTKQKQHNYAVLIVSCLTYVPQELRLEDYSANRKGPQQRGGLFGAQQTSTSSAFSFNQQKSGFGGERQIFCGVSGQDRFLTSQFWSVTTFVCLWCRHDCGQQHRRRRTVRRDAAEPRLVALRQQTSVR